VLLLQGVLAIVTGLVAFAWPVPTRAVMIGLFAICVLLLAVVGVVIASGVGGERRAVGMETCCRPRERLGRVTHPQVAGRDGG
jgi:uncharacterized membrane protein HdeD (DUF308 family)